MVDNDPQEELNGEEEELEEEEASEPLARAGGVDVWCSHDAICSVGRKTGMSRSARLVAPYDKTME